MPITISLKLHRRSLRTFHTKQSSAPLVQFRPCSGFGISSWSYFNIFIFVHQWTRDDRWEIDNKSRAAERWSQANGKTSENLGTQPSKRQTRWPQFCRYYSPTKDSNGKPVYKELKDGTKSRTTVRAEDELEDPMRSTGGVEVNQMHGHSISGWREPEVLLDERRQLRPKRLSILVSEIKLLLSSSKNIYF